MAPRHILVRGTKSGLPYSKGLLANSLSASGLATATAYAIAEHLEERLLASGVGELDVAELREAVARLLREEVGADASARYLNWQRARIRDRPLILMIGGQVHRRDPDRHPARYHAHRLHRRDPRGDALDPQPGAGPPPPRVVLRGARGAGDSAVQRRHGGAAGRLPAPGRCRRAPALP